MLFIFSIYERTVNFIGKEMYKFGTIWIRKLHHPRPTSKDIITTNPMTAPQDEIFPLPLQRKQTRNIYIIKRVKETCYHP